MVERNRAVATLAGTGLSCALLVMMWHWGWWGLRTSGCDFVTRLAIPASPVFQKLMQLINRDADEEDLKTRSINAASITLSSLFAIPVGFPVVIIQVIDRRCSQISMPVFTVLCLLGIIVTVMGISTGLNKMLYIPAPPPPAPVPDPRIELEAARQEAEYDSQLQLAVARAKQLKSQGQNQKAIRTLESALRDAMTQGRSVAHSQLHWYLGWLYVAEGDVGSAMVMFQAVVDIAEPDSEMSVEAREALDRLRNKSQGITDMLPPEESSLDEQFPLNEPAFRGDKERTGD